MQSIPFAAAKSIKRIGALFAVAAIVLANAGVLSVSAAEVPFYSTASMTQADCDNIKLWGAAAGMSVEKVPQGVRISLQSRTSQGASYYFPNQYNAEAADWSKSKYAEISLINENTFGTRLAFLVTEAMKLDWTMIEQFMLTDKAVAYLRHGDGTVTKADAFWQSVWIPGGFNGKVYIPIDEESLSAASWATIDGIFDVTKITGISYMLVDQDSRPIDSKFVIREVKKTDFDPASSAKDTYAAVPRVEAEPYVFPDTVSGMYDINAAGREELPDTPENPQKNGSGSSESESHPIKNILVPALIAAAVLILAGGITFVVMKTRKNKSKE